jgi:hypothetical protein
MRHRLLQMALALAGGMLPSAAGAQVPTPADFRLTLSTGAFGVPGDAQTMDWVFLNDAPDTQVVQITLWRLNTDAPKAQLPPGTLTLRVPPGQVVHHPTMVGPGGAFPPGYYFEVVISLNDRRVLPSVEIWSDRLTHTYPGARIGPRDFIELRN